MLATANKTLILLVLLSSAASAVELNLPQSCIDLAKREHIEIPRTGHEISLAQAQMSQFAAQYPNDFLLNKCRKEVQRMLSRRRE